MSNSRDPNSNSFNFTKKLFHLPFDGSLLPQHFFAAPFLAACFLLSSYHLDISKSHLSSLFGVFRENLAPKRFATSGNKIKTDRAALSLTSTAVSHGEPTHRESSQIIFIQWMRNFGWWLFSEENWRKNFVKLCKVGHGKPWIYAIKCRPLFRIVVISKFSVSCCNFVWNFGAKGLQKISSNRVCKFFHVFTNSSTFSRNFFWTLILTEAAFTKNLHFYVKTICKFLFEFYLRLIFTFFVRKYNVSQNECFSVRPLSGSYGKAWFYKFTYFPCWQVYISDTRTRNQS